MDATDAEQQHRRDKLRAWVAANGGHAAVVEKRRLTPSQASYLSQVVNGYSFASRAARNMEARLGMPQRYLDSQDAFAPVTLQTSSDPPTVAATLQRLGDLLQEADPKTRDMVAQLLMRYAQDPADGARIAQAIELLLQARGT